MAQAIFITTDDIKKYTPLNGNVDVDNFIQYIKIAQDIHIQGYLGTKLFNKINDDIVAGTLSGVYLALVNNYIKQMVIHWAMVQYLPFGAYTLANKGFYKHTSETSESLTKVEVDMLVEKERDIAQSYTQRFVDYMCYNYTDFPEWTENTEDDIRPNHNTTFSGWYL